MFRRLKLGGWRQFDDVDLVFHDRLTILTGANGSGKTTLLNVLSQHFGWSINLVSTPSKVLKGGIKYLAGFWEHREPYGDTTGPQGQRQIGELSYANGETRPITVPVNVAQQFQAAVQARLAVPGLFVSSHRPMYLYQPLTQIPTTISARNQLFANYVNEVRSTYGVGARAHTPSYRLKEALVSLATFGYGNQVVERNEESIRTFEGFMEVLRIVLPPSLGFERVEVRLPEVVLVTASGTFALEAVSGGISAIIDVAWQVYLASLINEGFTVVIDEPENHLHPELQRSLLPSFLEAFPSAQFVVASHNPFIVTSVPESSVYVLDYNDDRRVTNKLLDMINKAGTSNEVLRDVLGLSNTFPIWAEQRIEDIVGRYTERELSEASLRALREEMEELGLGHLFPSVVSRVFEGRG